MGSVTPAANPEEQLILTSTLFDPNIEKHVNLLSNLLIGADNCQQDGTRVFQVQKEVEPWMRDQVVKWMLEVCEEQKCSVRTFSQSVDLLDRYLAEVSIAKNQLQLAGISAIYIASKVVECLPLNVDTCVMYTDYSVTKDQLVEMEFIMIKHFKWEVYTVLACDLVLPLLYRLDLVDSANMNTIKSFLDLCLTESCFLPYSKRILTIACLSYALRRDEGGLPEYAKKTNRFKVKRLVKSIKIARDTDEDRLIMEAQSCYQLLKDFVRGVWREKVPLSSSYQPGLTQQENSTTTPEQIEPIHT